MLIFYNFLHCLFTISTYPCLYIILKLMRPVSTDSPGIAIIIPTLLLIFLLCAVDVVEVRGFSMVSALRDRQTVIVNRAAYGLQLPFSDHYLIRWGRPKRNEIVIYTSPLDGLPVIKRCIGVGGDTVIVEGITAGIAGKKYHLPPGKPQIAETIPLNPMLHGGR